MKTASECQKGRGWENKEPSLEERKEEKEEEEEEFEEEEEEGD